MLTSVKVLTGDKKSEGAGKQIWGNTSDRMISG